MVFLSHRHATAGEDDVVRHCRAAQCLHRGGQLVGHDAHVGNLATQAAQQGAQEKAVGVVDGTGRHVLRGHGAGHNQLVAGRKQRHAGATGYVQCA